MKINKLNNYSIKPILYIALVSSLNKKEEICMLLYNASLKLNIINMQGEKNTHRIT